jgi:hypothetical protein
MTLLQHRYLGIIKILILLYIYKYVILISYKGNYLIISV